MSRRSARRFIAVGALGIALLVTHTHASSEVDKKSTKSIARGQKTTSGNRQQASDSGEHKVIREFIQEEIANDAAENNSEAQPIAEQTKLTRVRAEKPTLRSQKARPTALSLDKKDGVTPKSLHKRQQEQAKKRFTKKSEIKSRNSQIASSKIEKKAPSKAIKSNEQKLLAPFDNNQNPASMGETHRSISSKADVKIANTEANSDEVTNIKNQQAPSIDELGSANRESITQLATDATKPVAASKNLTEVKINDNLNFDTTIAINLVAGVALFLMAFASAVLVMKRKDSVVKILSRIRKNRGDNLEDT